MEAFALIDFNSVSAVVYGSPTVEYTHGVTMEKRTTRTELTMSLRNDDGL